MSIKKELTGNVKFSDAPKDLKRLEPNKTLPEGK
jgi:hypothetical protein